MFSYLCKVLFSGFLQIKGNFVDSRNNRDVAPLIYSNGYTEQHWNMSDQNLNLGRTSLEKKGKVPK